MNNKTRNKFGCLAKYAAFYSYGQYKADESVFALVIVMAVELALWGAIAFFCREQVAAGIMAKPSFLVIGVSAKALLALVEKSGELGVGYNLTDYFFIKKSDVLKLRLTVRIVNAAEYFLPLCMVLYSIFVYKEKWFLAAAASIAALVVVSEAAAWFSYRYSGYGIPVINLVLFFIIAALICVMPFLFDCVTASQEVCRKLNRALTGVMAADLIFAAAAVPVVLHRKSAGRRNARAAAARKTGIPSLSRLMFRTEVKRILKDRASLWLMPFVYLAIFFICGDFLDLKLIMPPYFAVEFAIVWGLNYFGEDEELVTVFLSPAKRSDITRSKNGAYVFIVTLASAVVYAAAVLTGMYPAGGRYAALYAAGALAAAGIFAELCGRLSITGYYKGKGNLKAALRGIGIAVLAMLGFSLAESLVISFGAELPALCAAAILYAAALYDTCVSGRRQGALLGRHERRILDRFLGLAS